MREMYSRYHLPMIVTENGLGAYDTLEDGRVHDNYRIAYLRAISNSYIRLLLKTSK